ncbi:hypothetical protein M2451_003836 [Dysgonomonas sp. PFB1-18]|uniref:M12 family metallo-peptidase n=1 Tax=unclassified Dysgonomonas TaxID=2630389 RepID=UPI002476B69E|nr:MULTISPECIES: M12 family metallo-peptidase [unclassified Dysgonomonas]MDH6309482.1 hypothetical protein [Dysgonomonas sp. PF1-14]MDH6340892.1 hypothetical protein [Dysgonomonas sp. PF1-16]MDH6382495.1 hypothetical protein [Dysgonomonas sp. PFB1-18]MDH6399861.1 hypothetical protein [Dysgonomonas sp. PF1-23]
MTLRTEDVKNNSTPVSTWTGAPFVVEFRKDKKNLKPYFGFDWVDVDENEDITETVNGVSVTKKNPHFGKIIKHHGINILDNGWSSNSSFCEYKLNPASNDYDEIKGDGNIAIRRAIYSGDFKIYSHNNDKLHTSTGWVSLPDVNTDVNLLMKIKTKGKIDNNNPSHMFFKISQGLKLTIDGKVFDQSTTADAFEIKKKDDVKIKLKYDGNLAKDALLDIKIYNRPPDNSKENPVIIGELKVYAQNKIDYEVVIWPTLDISKYINKDKTKEQESIDETIAGLKLDNGKLTELNETLQKIFMQAGINMTAQYANDYLLYDIKNSNYAKYRDGNNGIKHSEGGNFFTSVYYDFLKYVQNIKDSTDPFNVPSVNGVKVKDPLNFPHNFKGTHLFIVDRSCVQMIYSDNKNPLVTQLPGSNTNQGYAIVGQTVCLLFKNTKDEFGIYAHEIGHTLGCRHTFKDSGSDGAEKDLVNKDKQIATLKYYAVENDINEKANFTIFLSNNSAEKKKYDDAIKNEQSTDRDVRSKADSDKNNVYATYYDSKHLNDPDVNRYIREKKELFQSLEIVLYTQSMTYSRDYSTANVMDYATSQDDFFKWQWLMLRKIVQDRK